jgi:hypothetical protein
MTRYYTYLHDMTLNIMIRHLILGLNDFKLRDMTNYEIDT